MGSVYSVCYFVGTHPISILFFFLMIRRPPRSTLDRSSAASDVYKRQVLGMSSRSFSPTQGTPSTFSAKRLTTSLPATTQVGIGCSGSRSVCSPVRKPFDRLRPVSYTHLRAHETVLDLVCRLLLEKKKQANTHE